MSTPPILFPGQGAQAPGMGKDFATITKNRTRRGMNEQCAAWLSAVEGLPEVHVRLKRVLILNDDALNVIRKHDGPNTLFYLDPPYLHDTRVTTADYEHEMTRKDHCELLELLATIQGKFMLSGYHSALYDTFGEPFGWRIAELETDCKSSGEKQKGRRTEVVWMNYEPETES